LAAGSIVASWSAARPDALVKAAAGDFQYSLYSINALFKNTKHSKTIFIVPEEKRTLKCSNKGEHGRFVMQATFVHR
jgi:hypothetical protein